MGLLSWFRRKSAPKKNPDATRDFVVDGEYVGNDTNFTEFLAYLDKYIKTDDSIPATAPSSDAVLSGTTYLAHEKRLQDNIRSLFNMNLKFGVESAVGTTEGAKERNWMQDLPTSDFEKVFYRDPLVYGASYSAADFLGEECLRFVNLNNPDKTDTFHDQIRTEFRNTGAYDALRTFIAFGRQFGHALAYFHTVRPNLDTKKVESVNYKDELKKDETVIGIHVFSPMNAAIASYEIDDTNAREGQPLSYNLFQWTETGIAGSKFGVHHSRIIHGREHAERANWRGANMGLAVIDMIIDTRKVIHSYTEAAYKFSHPLIIIRSRFFTNAQLAVLMSRLNSAVLSDKYVLGIPSRPEDTTVDNLSVAGRIFQPESYYMATKGYLEAGIGSSIKELSTNAMTSEKVAYVKKIFNTFKSFIIDWVKILYRNNISAAHHDPPNFDIVLDLSSYTGPEEEAKIKLERARTTAMRAAHLTLDELRQKEYELDPGSLLKPFKNNKLGDIDLTGMDNLPMRFAEMYFQHLLALDLQEKTAKIKQKYTPSIESVQTPSDNDNINESNTNELHVRSTKKTSTRAAIQGHLTEGTPRSDRTNEIKNPGTNPDAAIQTH